MSLRPYQRQAIEAIRSHWRAGRKRVVLVGPVAFGKTRVAEEMILLALANSDLDVWFLAHRVELLDQPARRFEKRGIAYGVVKSGVAAQSDRRVQIASVQTLRNRSLGEARGQSALVFVDEGHRTKAQSYLQILRDLRQTYAAVFIVYLTATPYRLDGQGLGDVADAMVEAATPRQLIADGYITEGSVIGRPPPDKLDRRAVDGDGEYDESAAESFMDRPKLVGDAVDTWRKHCDGWPGLARCLSKRSAMARAEAFRAAGFRVGYLDGETGKRERQSLLARLAIGGQRSSHPKAIDVLFFVNVLTEGYDNESSYDLVLNECRSELWPGRDTPPEYQPLCVLGDYAPTMSMGAFIQFWGRGSRVHPRKPWLRLLSHAGNEDEHCWLSQHEGFTLEHRQAQWLSAVRQKQAEQGVPVASGSVARVVCSACQTRWLAGTTRCKHCGSSDLVALRSREELDDVAPGELVEKKADAEAPRPPTPFELEAWFTSQFSELRASNARRASDGQKQHKPGTIYHKFKGIWKRDPPWDVFNRYKRQYGFVKEERDV